MSKLHLKIRINFFILVAVLIILIPFWDFSIWAKTTPSVSTGPAVLMSTRSVFLHGTVNPNASSTNVWFELGLTSALGQLRGYQWAGEGISPVEIRTGIINLQENTTYYYRIVAQSTNNIIAGETKSFRTTIEPSSSSNTSSQTNYNYYNYNNSTSNSNSNSSGSTSVSNSSSSSNTVSVPSVITNGPASVLANSATINGSINPNNQSTDFWFEFGTTTGLGQSTSIGTIASTNAWQLVTGNLLGLESNKTYYYRVVARNSQGVSQGNVMNFVTSSTNQSGSVANQTGPTNSQTSNQQVLESVSGNGNTNSESNLAPSIASGPYVAGTKTAISNSVASSDSLKTIKQINSRPSYISLEYSLNDREALVLVADNLKPSPGEEFSYTVTYRNRSNHLFNEANLKVIIPTEVSFVESSIDATRISGNVFDFGLGNISAQNQNAVVIKVKVDDNVKSGTNIIFTSVLGYKDEFGVQLANTSYMTVRVNQTDANDSGTFMGSPVTLVLIALGIVAILRLLTYVKIRNGKHVKKEVNLNEKQFDKLRVPLTVEPISAPMDRADIFTPIDK